MSRKSELLAEEAAVSSPLRRSTRKIVNSPAPAALSTRRTSQTHNELAPKTRRASLSQDNSEKDEKVDHKPATRGRRASTAKEEPELKPEPAKTRGRRSSASVEPSVEEPKPQTVTRRRRSSAVEDSVEPETLKPVRSRRSSAAEKPPEEEPPKKITRARRGSAKDDELKEEPVKRATRSRKGSVEPVDSEPKDKKPSTRGRRKSTDSVEAEPELKSIKLTPVKSRRIHSVTDVTVNLEPIEEIELEIKSRSSSSPITKEGLINLTPSKSKSVEHKANLELSIIDENSITEDTENDKDKSEGGTVTPRRSPRINKFKSTEKSTSPKNHLTMEKSPNPEVKDSNKEESTEEVSQPSPKKLNFVDAEESTSEKGKGNEVLAEKIDDEVFAENVETNTAEKETDKNEEVLEESFKKTLMESEPSNISMGSDGSFKFHLNVSLSTQNESLQEKDDLNSSKSSNTSDKENISENTTKSAVEEKAQVLSSLTNTPVKDKVPIQEETVVARVSNVFRPKMTENSFMEPMEVDEYPPALELKQSDLADSSTLTKSTLSTEDTRGEIELVEKNLKKESLIDTENDSVGDSFYLNLTNGAEEDEAESKNESLILDESFKIEAPEEKRKSEQKSETITSYECKTLPELQQNEDKDVLIEKTESTTLADPLINNDQLEPKPQEISIIKNENLKEPDRKRRSRSPSFISVETEENKKTSRKSKSPQPTKPQSNLRRSKSPLLIEEKMSRKSKSPQPQNSSSSKLILEEETLKRSKSPQPTKPQSSLRRSKSPLIEEKMSEKSKSLQPQNSPASKLILEEGTSRRSKSPQPRKSKSPQPSSRRSRSPLHIEEKISRKSKSPQSQNSSKSEMTLEGTSRRSKSPPLIEGNISRTKSPQSQSSPQSTLVLEEETSRRSTSPPKLRKSKSPQPDIKRSTSPQLVKEKKSRKSKSPQSSPKNKLILEEKTSRRSKSPQYQKSPPTSRRSKSPHFSTVQKPEKYSDSMVNPLLEESSITEVVNTSLLNTEDELNIDSDSIEQSTEKSPLKNTEKEVNITEDKLDGKSEDLVTTSQETLQEQSKKEGFSTSESPFSRNLKISDIEVAIRRSKSPTPVRRSRSPQTENTASENIPESDKGSLEEINFPSEKKDSAKQTDKEADEVNTNPHTNLDKLKDLETESKQSVDAAENTVNAPRKDSAKSAKSDTLDDYDFALPSDEDDAEKTHAPEYDESTVVASYIATSQVTGDVSTTVEMETVVIVDKTIDNSEMLEKITSPVEKCSDSPQNDKEEIEVETDTLQLDSKEKKVEKRSEDDEIFETSEILDKESVENVTDDDKDGEDSILTDGAFVDEIKNPINEERDEFENYDEEKINNSDMKSPQKKLKVRKCYLKKKMETYEEDLEKRNSEEDSEDDLPSPKRTKKPRKRCRVVEKDIGEDETIGEEDLEEAPAMKSHEKKSKSTWNEESDDDTEQAKKSKKDRKSKGTTKENVENIEDTKSIEKKSAKKKKKTISPVKPTKYSSSEEDSDLEKNTSKESADVDEGSERKSKKKKRKSLSPSKTSKYVKDGAKKSPASILREFTEKVAEEHDDEECSEEENSEEPNEYISTMAEEGEEDTPSEDSNAIIDEGESIGSTSSEYGSDDEDYENDSFICDEEDEQLLSGEEYDLSNERTKKKSRIIQLDNYDDDIIKIQRKEKAKPVEKKRSRIISITDSSESDEKEAEAKVKDSEEVMNTLEESSEMQEVVCVEENTDEVFIVETKPTAGSQEESANVSLAESPTQQRTEKRRLSSITIQENINVKEIKDAPLSGRIVNLLDSFCTTMRKGEISMNLSIECCANDDDSGEETGRKIKTKERRLSKSFSSVEVNKNYEEDASLEDEDAEEDGSYKPPKRLSVSMDHGSFSEAKKKAKKRRRLSKSMDHLDQIGTKTKKRKLHKKKKNVEKKVKTSPKKLLTDQIQSLGLLNQLITDIRNRPRRSVKPSTNMNNSWLMEVAHIKPSTTSFDKEEKAAYKAGKIHPKDFRSQMLNDPSRVRRIETKALLKKKGVHL